MKTKFVVTITMMMVMSFSFTGCDNSKDNNGVEVTSDDSNYNEQQSTSSSVKEKTDAEIQENGNVNVDASAGELKSHEGLMFTAKNSNWGEVSNADDYWCNTTYNIYYDGTIEVVTKYNLSGSNMISSTVSDEKLTEIYEFAKYNSEVDGFANLNVNACDGESWTFDYYNFAGEKIQLYSGYTYGNVELEELQEFLSGFAVE